MSNPSLFNLAQTYDAINRLLHEAMDEHGEVPPETFAVIDEWFAEADAMSEDKADAYAYTIDRLKADAKLCTDEAARLRKRAAASEAAIERLKERMKAFIVDNHNGNMKTTKHTFWVQSSAPSVHVQDATKLPQEFVRVIVEAEKSKLLALWKQEQPLPEGVTVTQGSHLRIK